MSRLGRQELIALVDRIKNASACVMDFDSLLSRFENNVCNPAVVQMIFDPPDGRELSAEEIVDRAMDKPSHCDPGP
ncbi:MAG: hypothetical protein VXX31_15065 [Planctomycetota bacterium]|nr:hypothetical protein [Planctomycetota bacterium]MEC8864276.1 hypothetical protein [Planctomycetota bacterium]